MMGFCSGLVCVSWTMQLIAFLTRLGCFEVERFLILFSSSKMMAVSTTAKRRKVYYYVGMGCSGLYVVLILVVIFSGSMLTSQKNIPAVAGGMCAIQATILSILQILEHLTCFSEPEAQCKIVRILFMVPLYALISWSSILSPPAATYLDLFRDAYESYAIYAFFSLMLALMGGMDALYRALIVGERDPIQHLFPFCYMKPMNFTPTFVQTIRRCIFQFMVLKPLVTFIVIILTAKHAMGDSVFDPARGSFWTALAYNVSITIALYGLAYFYTGTKEFLVGKGALAKFMCIKAIIFLSYWQGFVISILAAAGILPTFNYWSEKEAPEGLQDFLICVEMLLVAFAHKFCFGSDEYSPEVNDDVMDGEIPGVPAGRYIPPARLSIWNNLKYTLKHEDLISEVGDIVRNR